MQDFQHKSQVIHNDMMQRCYNPKRQAKQPTYADCEVILPWHDLEQFRVWMQTQGDVSGLHLDKDIIIPGNKLYAPDRCCFVANSVNKLLTDHRAARGKYPQGVSFHKSANKIRATISRHKKLKHLGYFPTVTQAEAAYRHAKAEYVRSIAEEQSDPRVRAGLLRHAKLLA